MLSFLQVSVLTITIIDGSHHVGIRICMDIIAIEIERVFYLSLP